MNDEYEWRIKMKTMSEYAFYKCGKIEHINLGYNQIDLVSEHAFYLNNKSDNKFNLYLYCNIYFVIVFIL